VTVRLARADVPVGVREFTLGAGAVTGLLVVVDVAGQVLRHRGDDRRRALFRLPTVVAVVAAVAVSSAVLLDPSGGPSPTLLAGAALMLLTGAGVGVWTCLRPTTAPTGAPHR
jgi:hypothetical protein